jgi:hypothetical protein
LLLLVFLERLMPHGLPPEATAASTGAGMSRTTRLLLVVCAVLVVALVAVGSSLATLLATDDQIVGGGAAPATGPSPTTPTVEPSVASPRPTPEPSQSALPTEEPTDLVELDPDATPAPVDPEAVFTTAYSDQRLRVTAPCLSRRVDLDEPRVGVQGSTYEFMYQFCAEKPELYFPQDVAVSRDGAEGATPGDCAEAVRTGVDANTFAPAAGDHICVITDPESAREQGIPHRIVLLSVLGIGADGTMAISATAWNVPG